ncbi:MAG: homoserine kinase [Pseudomonadota bacterium]
MAVYTEVSDDELAAFLGTFDVGELLSFKGIAEGVENTNYIVATTQGQFILTLYEKRVDPADLPFFLGLMDHLSAKQFACPTPIHDRVGQALGKLAGRPAALISFLDGIWIRRPQPVHCRAVGAAMAQMHLAGADFTTPRKNALGFADWRPLFERFETDADRVFTGLRDGVRSELDALAEAWPRDLPEGIIHADLFPDNVFFRGEQISGLIDFYFACNDAYAYDLAIALNAWCFEQDLAFNVTKARALLAGYSAVRPLTSDEVAALPTLCRGAALRFLLTRAYDWLHTPATAFVKPHDPVPYFRRMRFHTTIRSATEYGWERPE